VNLGTLDGGGWSAPRPGRLYPGKYPVPILQKSGCASEPVWIGAENLAHPGSDPRSESHLSILTINRKENQFPKKYFGNSFFVHDQTFVVQYKKTFSGHCVYKTCIMKFNFMKQNFSFSAVETNITTFKGSKKTIPTRHAIYV
jgi:hypothetical protein